MLVVEDDVVAGKALRTLMKSEGFDVRLATTLASAKLLLECEPDWILLDLMLPDGDGEEILRRIRISPCKTKICIMTGCGDSVRLTAVANLKPDAFLRKPINVPELIRILH